MRIAESRFPYARSHRSDARKNRSCATWNPFFACKRYAYTRGNPAGARHIKALSTYTSSLGMLLGIEGSEDTTDLSSAKPTLSATDLGGGKVELSFNKNKRDGVNIYGRREGDPDFVFLGRDLSSPFIDNRPMLTPGKPELRYFKAVYVMGDDEIGQFSDVVTVNCTP
ncbi:MAG: hypothetical protein PHE55_19515 [Methylococcaceae bacterium]|nr:hypothetical protein [Methylococcaceae bacterium]